jgi:hypothetical protein
MAIPTVHDRGLDYSNRFTLCRGCTVYPQSSGYSLCGHLPRITSYATTSTRSKPFAYVPLYGNLPYGVCTSPAHPGSLPPHSSITLVPHQETHSVFRPDKSLTGSRITIALIFVAIWIPGYRVPLYSCETPILK